MARRTTIAAIVLLACSLVVAIFVHASRRDDLLYDVLAVPPSGGAAVLPLERATTTIALTRTIVQRAGDVAVRVSLSGGRPTPTAITVRILGEGQTRLNTCRYARGSLRDTNVMRCPVDDLASVRRVRITLDSRAPGLGVVGSTLGVGSLEAPRSDTFAGRLRTVFSRLGAQHPAPFSGWLVPLGSVLWLSGLLWVAWWIYRSPSDG